MDNEKKKNNFNEKEPIHIIKIHKDVYEKSKKLSEVFNLYLPNESYEEYSQFNGKIKAVECFLAKNNYSLKYVSESKNFEVDVSNILKDKEFLSYWPEFSGDLLNLPNLVIGLFGFAMEKNIINFHLKEKGDDISDSMYDTEPEIPVKLNPRFFGLQNYLPFQDLKLCNYGKFVSLIGTVVRVSDVKPFCLYLAFKCNKCKTIQVVLQNNGCYTPPNTCIEDGCFCRIFRPLLNSLLTKTIPKKTIKLQEMNIDYSEVPKTVECELKYELTDLCMPGDTVILSGIVVKGLIDEKKTNGKGACSHVLQIDTNSIICLKGKNVDYMDPTSGCYELKSEDLGAIQKMHSEKGLFRLIVASLCPNIYGHELIKAGLVLGLFGGQDRSHKEGEKTESSIRENSHILIVGDSGLGKSQMLLACSNVSPRGVYVCGKSTTSSGLTVTVNKEGSRGNSLQVGALPLTDSGHCCIDQLEGIEKYSAILEAMEQQTISIAKNGLVCTLPARTSILAAINPSGGHYNKAKTVSENLRIRKSLLSRFDLVFIIQDKPDYETDSKMCKHIVDLHRKNKIQTEESSKSNNFFKITEIDNSLLKRLKIEANEKIDLIPPDMLKKYISYARKFFQPKITPEISACLKDFYLNMRKKCPTTITIRLLESLIRLTKARARIELRYSCNKTDAEEVIEIMNYSMSETYSEFGDLNFNRSVRGSRMSTASQVEKLKNLMIKVASKRGDYFSEKEIMNLCIKLNIFSCYSFIDILSDEGFILKRGPLYKIQKL